MFEHLIEFTHTMQEIVRIYHAHDTSMNAKLDALLVELKAILAELKRLNGVAPMTATEAYEWQKKHGHCN